LAPLARRTQSCRLGSAWAADQPNSASPRAAAPAVTSSRARFPFATGAFDFSQDGFKVHVAVEPGTEPVTDCALTKAVGAQVSEPTVGLELPADGHDPLRVVGRIRSTTGSGHRRAKAGTEGFRVGGEACLAVSGTRFVSRKCGFSPFSAFSRK
jgi:hypothetical protein